MNAPRAPRDRAARITAATDFTINLVVSAGAGTGKTSLMVERMLNAIGSGAAALPAIAAITFTDKAAGELRHRLASGLDELGALARGAEPSDPDAPSRRAFAHLAASGIAGHDVAARAAEALARLDRAAVATIHGFCSDILRGHPLEAGLPPGFAVERGAAAGRLAQEEWRAFLDEELGPSGRRAGLWARALEAVSLADAEAIGRALAGGGIPDDVLASGIKPFDLHGDLAAWATELADLIRAAACETNGLSKAPGAWLAEAEGALLVFASDGPAAARRFIEHAARIPESMPSVRTTKVSGAEAERLEDLAARAQPLLRGLAKLDEASADDVFAALLPFARRLRTRQLRAGLTDFDALLVRARDLLRDHLAVRESLKRRFRMILLDEFQDTDPIQYEIVFYASEIEGGAARDAYATRLAPGKLFIVGDAKQSIYRFRGADYTAYRRAVEHVKAQGGHELTLSSNFRSVPAVVEPINLLLGGGPSSSWRASRHQPDYERIDAERDGPREPAVEVWTADAGAGALSADRRLAEGRALAAELAANAGPGRDVRHQDVLVLFRAFSNVTPYLRALREAGVPFVVSGGRTFSERTEIVQAMAVLRAIATPENEVALLAYLRSPAGGVPDAELAAHAAARGAWAVDAAVDARACPTLAAALGRLGALCAEVAGLPVDTAVRHVLDRSGLRALSGLAFEASQRVANLEKLALAAGTVARDGRLTLAETLDAIEEGLEVDEEGDSPLADETVEAVRVMTIHKAKGLEAKFVVLADTAAGRNHQADTRWKVGMASLSGADYVRLEGPPLRNACSVAATLEDRLHDEAEHVRLLYVALTRARDRLVVFGGGTRSTPWIQALSAWGYDAKAIPADDALIAGGAVRHRVVAAPAREARRAAGRPAGEPEAVARYDAAVEAVARRAAPPFLSPSRFEERGALAGDAGEGALAPERAREVGTLVHARLAGIPAASTDGEVAREADELMAAFAASPLAARLASLDVLGREVPVLFDEGHARWRGVIDLIYRDADGTVVVADFKTDASAEGALDRHAPQLGVYRRALERAMPDADVRAELWMLRSGQRLEV